MNEKRLEKQVLRQFLTNRRSELSSSFEKKNNIHIHIQPLIETIKNVSVGTYMSFRNELNTKKLNEYLFKRDINLALPVIDFKKKEISFFRFGHNTKLIKNNYSILEPENKNELIFPKIILIPLLGYSLSGYRIGYGGGYYDKYLSKHSKSGLIKIGTAFTFQEVDQIPIEGHDQRLDWILTEKHLYKVQ